VIWVELIPFQETRTYVKRVLGNYVVYQARLGHDEVGIRQALRKIPAGATATYAEIAERIGSPKSVRAVAQACGANPVAVAIPCHRVVRSDGALSGYRWGVERKRTLLEREAS
jgi:O-6-methylguanine DNA methyltransferase